MTWAEDFPTCEPPFAEFKCPEDAIIFWYDQPIMWWQEDGGKKYVCQILDDLDDNISLFNVVEVSSDRLQALLGNKIEVRKLYTEAETVWVMLREGYGDLVKCWQITADQIPEDHLANKDLFLRWDISE